MTVREANERLKELERLAKNTRLVNQYFLQLSDEELENIADKHGIDSPIKNVMSEVTEEMYSLAEKYQVAIEESEIKLNV